MRGIGIFLTLISSIFFVAWAGYRIVADINFNRLCIGYLKNAADANGIEQAEERLSIAVKYIEQEGYTEGFTSILWRTPDADVGFWYKNLSNALQELQELPENSTPLEKSNMLMKLRETILDDTSEGVSVTVPGGISIFPNNVAVCVWGCVSFLLGICGVLMFIAAPDDWHHRNRRRW